MDYSIYQYFRGEKNNPFDKEKENTAFMFWGYEEQFESKFKAGDYNLEKWYVPYASDAKEWKIVLTSNPVNKEDVFKLYIYRLLLEFLPDKYGHEKGDVRFVRSYYGFSIT